MGTGARTRIVKIGNSRGVRIPKLLLDQAQLGNEIEIEVQGDQLRIWKQVFPNLMFTLHFVDLHALGQV